MRIAVKHLAYLLLLAFNGITELQAQPLPIRLIVASEDSRLPQIALSTPSARKINFTIQHEVMGMIAEGAGLDKTFKAQHREEGEGWLAAVGSTILRNDGKIFSIEINFEGIGAYVSSQQRTLSFDVATGRRLGVQDIIDPAKLALFKAEYAKIINPRIDSLLIERGVTEDEDLAHSQAMLRECLADDSELELGITANDISFSRHRCLPHVVQAHEIDWRMQLTPKTHNELFTEYGKALFNKRSVALPERTSFIAFLEGSVGKSPVTMMVDHGDDGPRGWYFYNTRGIPLSLGGDYFKDEWHLKEYTEVPDGKMTGKFDGIFDFKSFKGTWSSADGKKKLPFDLKVF